MSTMDGTGRDCKDNVRTSIMVTRNLTLDSLSLADALILRMNEVLSAVVESNFDCNLDAVDALYATIRSKQPEMMDHINNLALMRFSGSFAVVMEEAICLISQLRNHIDNGHDSRQVLTTASSYGRPPPHIVGSMVATVPKASKTPTTTVALKAAKTIATTKATTPSSTTCASAVATTTTAASAYGRPPNFFFGGPPIVPPNKMAPITAPRASRRSASSNGFRKPRANSGSSRAPVTASKKEPKKEEYGSKKKEEENGSETTKSTVVEQKQQDENSSAAVPAATPSTQMAAMPTAVVSMWRKQLPEEPRRGVAIVQDTTQQLAESASVADADGHAASSYPPASITYSDTVIEDTNTQALDLDVD